MTHSVLHGFNYSPPEIPFPGWIRYGTFFSEKNPWWSYFEKWAMYNTRISTVMQHSENFADIAVLHPLADMWSMYGPQRDPFPGVYYPDYQYRIWDAIHRNGNACDYVSEEVIRKSSCKDGCLTYGNRKYHTLMLLKVESLHPETAEKLLDFVKNGGKVIFVESEPFKSAGLQDYKNNDQKVKGTIRTLKKKYASSVFTVDPPQQNETGWFKMIQEKCDIKPYIKFSTVNLFVNQIRQQTETQDIYFISNCNVNNTISFDATFPHKNRQAWIWDPESGERYLYSKTTNNTLHIELEPATSKLIVFEKNKIEGKPLPILPQENANPLLLTDWQVTMRHINGEVNTRQIEELPDWSTLPETRSFAGELVYTTEVVNSGNFNYLDLGKVYGVSEVWVNGKNLGSRWYGRHLYLIPKEMAAHEKLEIKVMVTTTAGNYLKSDKANKVGQYWTFYQSWQPMGMLGEVKLF
ncbi:hypothetical protein LJC67_02715 [Bacteroidales bacterium OttesenSCG-928-A14]|nr:hypothetical protein [Bacteroidales bacterium OttesenSCG-928-A14]